MLMGGCICVLTCWLDGLVSRGWNRVLYEWQSLLAHTRHDESLRYDRLPRDTPRKVKASIGFLTYTPLQCNLLYCE